MFGAPIDELVRVRPVTVEAAASAVSTCRWLLIALDAATTTWKASSLCSKGRSRDNHRRLQRHVLGLQKAVKEMVKDGNLEAIFQV